MKRRLQMYLERTYGSAYSGGPSAEAASPVKQGDPVKDKKGRAAKQKSKPPPPPDGGRFDLRYGGVLGRGGVFLRSKPMRYCLFQAAGSYCKQ